MAVFEGVRLCHVITDFKCAATLENEHIIPRHWIANEYRAQWLRMLRVENSYDSGTQTRNSKYFLGICLKKN